MPNKPRPNNPARPVRIEDGPWVAVQEIAAEDGISASEVVREAVHRYIKLRNRKDATMSDTPMEREAKTLLPKVGDIWEWEPLKPHAREVVWVTEVQWNGEEWWIESEPLAGGRRCWNDASRWVEATVLVTPAE